jgi:hypothetical protein
MLGAMNTALYSNPLLLRVCIYLISLALAVTPCLDQGDPWQSLRLLKRGLGFVFIGTRPNLPVW